MNTFKYYPDPNRHFWPLKDGLSIVWSPNLPSTVLLQNADLWPLLQAFKAELQPTGYAATEDNQPIGNFLLSQGYLLSQPAPTQPPVGETDYVLMRSDQLCRGWRPDRSLPTVVLWEPFDLQILQNFAPVPWEGLPLLHLFPGDGVGNGWCLREETGGVCFRCQVFRWLANRALSQPLALVQSASLSWPGEASWAPYSTACQMAVRRSLESGASLVWEGERSWPCQPVSRPGCPCGQQLVFSVPESFQSSGTNWEWLEPLGVLCQSAVQDLGAAGWLCSARTGQVDLLGGLEAERSEGAGLHPDYPTATRQAAGEALERYCARWRPPGSPPADPRVSWTDFSKNQLRSQGFPYTNNHSGLSWSLATDLATAEPLAVPTQALLLCAPAGEKLCYPNLSHGLCCHLTLEQALWGGLWELLERDAVASWWATLNSPRFRETASREISQQGPHQVLEIPCLAGHCMLAWTLDSQGRRASGTAAGPDPDCAHKAIQESNHNFHYLSRASQRPTSSESPTTFQQHLNYYWNWPERFPERRLTQLSASWPSFPAEKELSKLAQRLRDRGIRIYWSELTTRDVANLGRRVVKVFSPDLLYLPANHLHWPLARSRYRGLTGHRLPPAQPHPFG